MTKGSVLVEVDREGLPEGVGLEQRPAGGEGIHRDKIRVKSILDRTAKVAYPRSSQEASVAAAAEEGGKVMEGDVGEVTQATSRRT